MKLPFWRFLYQKPGVFHNHFYISDLKQSMLGDSGQSVVLEKTTLQKISSNYTSAWIRRVVTRFSVFSQPDWLPLSIHEDESWAELK